jgi:hypothetical protein
MPATGERENEGGVKREDACSVLLAEQKGPGGS